MGRPIKKKWFGPVAAPGRQIIVGGAKWADGTAVTNPYIQSQTGDNAYMVQDTLRTHNPEIMFLVNATIAGALGPSQMFVNATPFGGSALPAKKIAQYRITLFTTPYSTATPRPTGVPANDPVANYTWSTIPATKAGQVDLITDTGGTGIVATVAVTTPPSGAGYFVAPTVAFPTGTAGFGATATSTINATGGVTGVTLVTPGYGYTAGALTFGAPPASVTATATATQTGGLITAITLVNGGGFYLTAPTVTINPVGGGTLATATASISGGRVVGFTITAPGSGYVTPTVTVGAPPAAATAAGTFTVTTIAGPLSEEGGQPPPAGGEEPPPSSPATATATATDGEITSVTIDDGGSGYTTAPVVTFGGGGTGATGTATVVDGAVTEITVTAGGTGYTTPTVTIAAPPVSARAAASASKSKPEPSAALATSQGATPSAQERFRASELKEQTKNTPFKSR